MGATSSSVGERRQITVMFSDLVGSTGLSTEIDPEDLHAILTLYHQTVTSVVKQNEGYVYQVQGDGVLVLFGYPIAKEKDAERAVRTGLNILEQMKFANQSLQMQFGKRLAVRIGIHTGEVMVRSDGGDFGTIFGETLNVASRVQTAAEPNTVCISAATQRLVAGFFVVEDLGPHILKGVPDPIRLYRVDRVTGVRSRLHATSKSMLTAFVGREEERNLLMNRWIKAEKGKGQLVMITGEAGIGKSRLLQQFKEDLGGIPHTWIEGESSPYEQDTPFAPTLNLVANALQWTQDTTAEEKIEGLKHSFSLAGIDPAKSVPLLAALFGFNVPPDRYPPLLLSPEQQRGQLLQTLVDWAIGNAHLQPSVLVIEDLQYADPSTLEEFVLLSEQMEETPLLLIFTARPKFIPPWPTRDFHSLITLNRMDQENICVIIEGLLGRELPGQEKESLVTRADGVPLFAEELAYALAETRQESSSKSQIPATLQDLLMARLDHLGPLKEIAQIGSVFGREFSFTLLDSIAGMPEADLKAGLARLVESGLIYAETSSVDTTYTFKHALLQETAYSSLLKSRRRELHHSVATALRDKFSEMVKKRPELVAHHLTEAGQAEQAVEAWQTAGDFAMARAALVEARQHYIKALDILRTFPETPDRAQMELPLQISLGHIAWALNGFGSIEEVNAFSRAREIAGQLEESPQFFFILLGLWSTTNTRSEIKASRELSDALLRIADRDQTPLLEVWAHLTQAIDAYAIGLFVDVGKHVDLLRSYYNKDDHTWAPFDPFVTVLGHASYALWQLGFVDRALQTTSEQLEIARQISPANIAMARMTTCNLSMYLQDADALTAAAQDMLMIGEEQQLPSFLGWGTMYHGIGLILQRKTAEGIAMLTKGIGGYLASGTHSSLGWYLSRLAVGYAQAGDVGRALETIEDAFGSAQDETMHFPEFYRLRADFLLMKGDREDLGSIEEDYRQAIAVSKQFNALMQELRAAVRLGRLLQSQERASEAYALLSPLYARFTEGFDTPDLIEAGSLLDELSKSCSSAPSSLFSR